MKKLMFVAALAAAMTGLADVEGANVVGYANKAVNLYKIIVNQFRTVGGGDAGEGEMTLGQITTNCAGEDGEYVSGWDWEGDLLITWGVVNGKGKSTGTYKYLPKWATEIEDGDYEGRTPGWYAFDDDGCEECLNGVKLESGDGFVIKSGADDSAIQINKNPLAK